MPAPRPVTLDGTKYPTGWMPIPREVDRILGELDHPVFGVTAAPLQDSGKGKVVLLHKAVRKVAGHDLIHEQTIGDCFVAGTIVLGEETKPIEDVVVGDRIWTAEGRLTRVISTRAIETVRPLVRVRPVGGLPVTCTADHKFLVYRMKRVGGKRVNPTWYAKAQLPNQAFSKAAVIACFEGRRPEWVAADDLRDTDCLLTPIRLESMPVPDSPGGLLATPEGRFVAGYFLGDGHASGGTVELAVADDTLANRLAMVLQSVGFQPIAAPYRAGCGAWRLRIHSRELVRWAREQFYRGKAKRFPAWAIGDPDFLAGLQTADGQVKGDKKTIDSTSVSVAHGAVASLIALGYEPTIGLVTRSGGEYANAQPLHRVIWREGKQKSYIWRDERFICRPVESVEPVEGPTTVYDIGVDDDHHSFMVNGYSVHNCVSHGWSLGVDVLKCVQITAGRRERYTGETATEVTYAGARVEIGGGRCGTQDGAVGAWAAKFVKEYGTLARGKYGKYDLTTYSGKTAKAWGMPRAGVPDELEPTLREHSVQTVSLVSTYEEARDAIANGYPVPVCSNQGFAQTRDEKGFAAPKGQWAHCMCFIAVDDADGRPGLCCMNSWGSSWITGPKRHDQPDGSFWVDAATAGKMLRGQDSFALSGYMGFPVQSLDYDFLGGI